MSAWALLPSLLILLLASVVGLAVARFAFRAYRRSRREAPNAVSTRCRCGYELDNLDRIRCPECGRVFGFDATPEALGLSDEELRRATEARERRRSTP